MVMLKKFTYHEQNNRIGASRIRIIIALKPYNLNKQKFSNFIFILCMHEFNSRFREIIHAFQLKTVKRIFDFFLQNVGCECEIQKIGTIQNWCLTRNVTIYLSYE